MIDVKKLTQAVADLDEDTLLRLLNNFVETHPTAEEAQAVVKACQEGMGIVGMKYESGEYFVGDLIIAGELLTSSIDILKPTIGGQKNNTIGKIVLGTVSGDLHDIGKNIFRSMAEAAGFEVFDLGIDQSPSAFVAKIKQVRPNIVGMSGLLTLAFHSMKNTVSALEEEGLRQNLKILIGGAPVSAQACEFIGADAFTTSAPEGVKICEEWVSAIPR